MEISFCLETMKHKHQGRETVCIFLWLQTTMIPPLQKGKLSKNRKSQASDFKRTWELWMPYSPECCSCGVSIQSAQKKSNSVDIKTSENIFLGLIPGPLPWARTNLSWSNHWCYAGPFNGINSRWEPA